MKLVLPCLSLLAGAALLAGCNRDAPLPVNGNLKEGVLVSDARMVLPVVSGSPAAAYFKLANETDQPVRVMTIDVDGAQMAMMHETVDFGGHSRMQMLQSLDVPAHQSVTFAPGGKHVMVSGLSAEVKANTMSRITFTFADGDKLAEQLPVVSPAVGGSE